MIMLEPFFDVWKSRSRHLRQSFDKIRFLTPNAQYLQAILVRNACTDCLKKIEISFNSAHAKFIAYQDEVFLAEVDDARMLNFSKRPWPLDQDVPQMVKEKKEALAIKVKLWMKEAADFEARMMVEKKERTNEVHVTLGRLMTTYRVSRRGKK